MHGQYAADFLLSDSWLDQASANHEIVFGGAGDVSGSHFILPFCCFDLSTLEANGRLQLNAAEWWLTTHWRWAQHLHMAFCCPWTCFAGVHELVGGCSALSGAVGHKDVPPQLSKQNVLLPMLPLTTPPARMPARNTGGGFWETSKLKLPHGTHVVCFVVH